MKSVVCDVTRCSCVFIICLLSLFYDITIIRSEMLNSQLVENKRQNVEITFIINSEAYTGHAPFLGLYI